MTLDRFFYHSFPRRGANQPDELDKGCSVLEAICDFGLVLVPEYIIWRQPTSAGTERALPVLQKRVCFTELSLAELPQHSQKFGRFSLEFDTSAVRALGAIPVFYLPQPTNASDGNALGVALLSIVMDASAVVHRLASLENVLNGNQPVADTIKVHPRFAGSPEGTGDYDINSKEARNFIKAIGHAVTPLEALNHGMEAVLNFFYPADDIPRDGLLEYYRQREWRIASPFAINGVEVMRPLAPEERKRLIEIDANFFSRKIKTDLGPVSMLDAALVHPGIKGKRVIEMVRRVVVPSEAVQRTRDILARLPAAPPVIALESSGDSDTN